MPKTDKHRVSVFLPQHGCWAFVWAPKGRQNNENGYSHSGAASHNLPYVALGRVDALPRGLQTLGTRKMDDLDEFHPYRDWADSWKPGEPIPLLTGNSLVQAIRDRPNDAPLPTEYLLDQAADELERLMRKIEDSN